MNNFYLQKQVVKLKMQKINREIEQNHLLKEAGISRYGWLARAAKGLRNLLVARKSLRANHPAEDRPYQPVSHKVAP